MIYLRPPTFVYHNHNVEQLYKMDANVVGNHATTLNELVTKILKASFEASFLRNVVINTHGFAGGIYVGNNIYLKSDLHALAILTGRIKTVWFTSCETAKDSAGQAFCLEFSRITRSNVVASADFCRVTWREAVGLFLGSHQIDDYGADVYVFRPNGTAKRVKDPVKELGDDNPRSPEWRGRQQ
jgi:hypothetical protein